jgi:hypothetical protein
MPHPTNSVILAKLAALDSAFVIPILAPAPGIEPPRLHRSFRALRDAHVAPRGRYAKALNALDGRAIADDSPGVIDVRESFPRRSSPNDPPITHTTSAKASSGPPPYI